MAEDNIKIEELSLEQAFDELNGIMQQMSEDDIALEKSFELYKKGVELLNHCSSKIEKVEKEIEILSTGEEE